MKIVCLSDTHGYDLNSWPIPECDLLIHCGDILPTHYGPKRLSNEIVYQDEYIDEILDELISLPAKEIVFIAGNHDFWMQRYNVRPRISGTKLHYLEEEIIDLFGLTIYGSPWTPWFWSWAFNTEEEDLDKRFAAIPDTTDILVTHGPPHGILDHNARGENCGSIALRKHLDRIKPVVHCFGHIHDAYGETQYGSTKLINCAVFNRKPPITLEL